VDHGAPTHMYVVRSPRPNLAPEVSTWPPPMPNVTPNATPRGTPRATSRVPRALTPRDMPNTTPRGAPRAGASSASQHGAPSSTPSTPSPRHERMASAPRQVSFSQRNTKPAGAHTAPR
jgi:hypothetical protein